MIRCTRVYNPETVIIVLPFKVLTVFCSNKNSRTGNRCHMSNMTNQISLVLLIVILMATSLLMIVHFCHHMNMHYHYTVDNCI